MKKITFLAAMLSITGASFAQSQRLPLLEEFTQASCGPCAAANPALNTLLSANAAPNTVKTVSIKYQTSWPGVDPMNAQNPSEVATRVSYYGVSGVPDIEFDGTVISGGSPGQLTQTAINNEYAVASPFTINLSHTLSSDYDSVFVTMVITCSQAVSGPLKAHVALVEKEIHFATAPGSNGEKDFYSVMRKMLPNASGTTLATSWTVGQTQTLNFAAPIPSEYGLPVPGYIYNLNELGVVAFIQDNTTKNVKQAAISYPITLPTSTEDAGVTVITAPAAVQCNTSITPVVTIKNFSANTLTGCNVNYQIDGGAVVTMPWTGSLATNATATFTFPTATTTVGTHTIVSWTSEPNGNNDWFLNNSRKSKKFSIFGTPGAAPLAEGFSATGWPYNGWALDNPDNAYTWERITNAGGFSTSGQALRMSFYNSPSGQIDDFYAPAMDLTTANNAGYLYFDVAYAQYQTENDRLQVHVSTNCGSTWTQLYNKQGSTLKTAPATTSSFTPSASQWRKDTVNITSYLNNSNVLFRFRATSNYGNNLFVDNININTVAVGVEEISNVASMDVYPNPFSSNTTIEVNLTENQNVKVDVYNVVGQNVFSVNKGTLSTGEHKIALNAEELPAGMYFITLTTEKGRITKRVSVNK
ncbi:MAG: T9SS type A sorting domain-containing protein [Bacteroidia bacterium]|nr:T9SS type A sorting domain-containing protein [Bacteroidia bacterium]